MSDLAIVVVNHQGAGLLGPCLASIAASVEAAQVGAEVVVVDNASTDGSAEIVEGAPGSPRLIRLGRNLGFGAAVERGVDASSAPWILVLNNDVVVERDAIDRLVRLANDRRVVHARVGTLAADLRFVAAPQVVNSAGIAVDGLGVAFDRAAGRPAAELGEDPTEVFGASAGAAMYRRSMLEEVGGFDPSFFLYLEDVDLAWRARMHGWRTLHVPGAVVLHHHSATAGHESAGKLYLVGRNRVRLLAKNATGRQLALALPRIVAYDAAYVAYAAIVLRTLAPLRGRLAGLRRWRSDRRMGAQRRRTVELAPVEGLAAALRRRRVWRANATPRPPARPARPRTRLRRTRR